jgi:hypothetical protein
MKLSFDKNPFGNDLLGFNLDVDTKWLARQMLDTGKAPGEIITDHIREAFKKSLLCANRINQQHAREFK